MQLRANGFELRLAPLSRRVSDGWTDVAVEVSVTGFTGRFSAQLEIQDLQRFADELQHMEEHIGQGGKAVLLSAEPDLRLELAMNRLGQITGRYALESERRSGVPTALTGAFELDQTFLRPLRLQCVDLVHQLVRGETC